jgi:integrase
MSVGGWTQINLAPQTKRERVIAVRAHLKPFFPGLAGDIDVRSVEAYKALRMAKGISPWTMNNELKVLSCILKFGVENKYLEEIPRIRRVKIQKKSPRFLSVEEIGKVLASARPEVRPMLQLLIFTGLRKGEVRHPNGATWTSTIACSTSARKKRGGRRPRVPPGRSRCATRRLRLFRWPGSGLKSGR